MQFTRKNVIREVLILGALGALMSLGVLIGRETAPVVDRGEAVIDGAYMSWSVYTECERGPEACDKVLAEVNNDRDGVLFFEDGTAYRLKDADKYK